MTIEDLIERLQELQQRFPGYDVRVHVMSDYDEEIDAKITDVSRRSTDDDFQYIELFGYRL